MDKLDLTNEEELSNKPSNSKKFKVLMVPSMDFSVAKALALTHWQGSLDHEIGLIMIGDPGVGHHHMLPRDEDIILPLTMEKMLEDKVAESQKDLSFLLAPVREYDTAMDDIRYENRKQSQAGKQKMHQSHNHVKKSAPKKSQISKRHAK